MEVFDRIARRIERSGGANYQARAEFSNSRQKLVKSAVVMADELRAEAILVFTNTGTMARYTAWMRPRCSPIYAVCPTQRIADSLTLNWGVNPVLASNQDEPREQTIDRTVQQLVDQGRLHRGGTIVIISSIHSGESLVNAVQMRVLV